MRIRFRRTRLQKRIPYNEGHQSSSKKEPEGMATFSATQQLKRSRLRRSRANNGCRSNSGGLFRFVSFVSFVSQAITWVTGNWQLWLTREKAPYGAFSCLVIDQHLFVNKTLMATPALIVAGTLHKLLALTRCVGAWSSSLHGGFYTNVIFLTLHFGLSSCKHCNWDWNSHGCRNSKQNDFFHGFINLVFTNVHIFLKFTTLFKRNLSLIRFFFLFWYKMEVYWA